MLNIKRNKAIEDNEIIDKNFILLCLPTHYFKALSKIDAETGVTLHQRILVAIGEYLIRYCERQKEQK